MSLQFTAELKARTGVFTFYWQKSGEHFDPSICEVDTVCQSGISDEELPNTNIAMRKQTVVCTTMLAVRRVMSGKDREGHYAKAMVVLRTPYVK